MAVTNHPKMSDVTPAWAERGKLRIARIEGGPSATAKMILLDGWNSTPAELMSTGRYGPELVDELVAKNINAAILTWSPGFSHEGDAAQWEIVRKLLPLLKKKKIKAIAQISMLGCFHDEMSKRVPQFEAWLSRNDDGKPIAWNESRKCFEMNAQSTEWREYLKHKVIAAIDAGFDGIFFDDAVALPSESAELLSEMRAAAREKRGEKSGEFLYFTHTWLFSAINKVCNFKWCDAGRKPGVIGTAGLATNLPVLKFAFEECSRDIHFASAFHSGELSPRELKLAAAEILASGGSLGDHRAPQAYLDFAADNSKLYGASDPVSSIGVLLNDAGTCVDNIFSGSIAINALSTLLRGNIQFDIIPTAQLASFDLRKYSMLSALHLHSMSSPVLKALESFMREHRGVVLIGAETAAADPDGNSVQRPELLGPPIKDPREERKIGEGRLIQFGGFQCSDDEDIAQNEFREWILPEFRRDSQSIEVQAPEGVVVLLWGNGTKRWVHVINYRPEKCDATITLPNCGGRKIEGFSPDESKPELRIIETGHASASFSLSGIDTYCVVDVR